MSGTGKVLGFIFIVGMIIAIIVLIIGGIGSATAETEEKKGYWSKVMIYSGVSIGGCLLLSCISFAC